MAIIVSLDVVMAKRKISLSELAEKVGITNAKFPKTKVYYGVKHISKDNKLFSIIHGFVKPKISLFSLSLLIQSKYISRVYRASLWSVPDIYLD